MAKKQLNIADASEFSSGLDVLGMELARSQVIYKLFLDINNAFNVYRNEANAAPAFWGITRDALRDIGLLGLCRVYDGHDGTPSLPNVLAKIASTPDFATLVHTPEHGAVAIIDGKQLARDLKFVSPDNISVKRLLAWRSEAFVHVNWKGSTGAKIFPTSLRPKFSDFDALFVEGLKIINRYARLFRNREYGDFMPGSDDYLFVFKSIKANLQLIKEQQEAEFAKYRANQSSK